jgi:hypothetical protein
MTQRNIVNTVKYDGRIRAVMPTPKDSEELLL